jgi:hypothetical protein
MRGEVGKDEPVAKAAAIEFQSTGFRDHQKDDEANREGAQKGRRAARETLPPETEGGEDFQPGETEGDP